MGDALFELEHVLRSRKEKLTIQEANLLLAWRAKAMRDFIIGFGGGSIVTWLATQRLTNLFRINFTLGAAALCGFWKFSRSVESCVDHVLSLEGSRIQWELANIMLKKYRDDPWVLRRLSKHFYSEEVYEDSSIDKPVFRWRFRNFYGDPTDRSQDTSQTEETGTKKMNVKKPTVESNQVHVNAGGDDATENPIDFVFGLTGSTENGPDPEAPSTPSLRQIRKEKRNRRKMRRHHENDSEI